MGVISIKRAIRILGTLIFLILWQSPLYANSSWLWLTRDPRPMLPFAIVLTLAIETFIISKYNKINKHLKVFFTVTLANLVSFIVPYLLRTSDGLYTLEQTYTHLPIYIVMGGYLVLTLIFEMPVTYFILKKDTKSRKRLIGIIVIANAFTTTLVAIMERVIFRGSW